MHNAPPVVFPVGRFVWRHAVLWGLALSGAGNLVYWQTNANASTQAGAWALWVLCVFGAFFTNVADVVTQGYLVWTGEVWLWRDPKGQETKTELRVLLDVESALGLVLLADDGHRRWSSSWVWLDRRDLPQMWHGLRCAVYSR